MSKRLAATLGLAALAAAMLGAHAVAGDLQQELADRRAKAAAKTADSDRASARYAVGLWAQENGLAQAARQEFEAVIGLDTDHEGARRALGHQRAGTKWYTREAAMKAKGLILRDGAWLLPEEARILDMPASEKERRKEAHAKVDKLLKTYAGGNARARKFAVDALGTVEDEYKLEPFAYALRSRSDAVRALAAKELGKLKSRRAMRPLLHRAIFDQSQDVRYAAIDAAKAIGDENLVAPFVRALNSEDTKVRTNAAQAIGRIGDVRGVTYLVYKYEAHGGGSPRVHFMQANQLTFIQDFDVEVAQTAFIADPIVGVIQDGTVLDAQVVATSETGYFVEREAIHGALRTLTGAEDVENKSGAWAKWYRENKDKLAAK